MSALEVVARTLEVGRSLRLIGSDVCRRSIGAHEADDAKRITEMAKKWRQERIQQFRTTAFLERRGGDSNPR